MFSPIPTDLAGWWTEDEGGHCIWIFCDPPPSPPDPNPPHQENPSGDSDRNRVCSAWEIPVDSPQCQRLWETIRCGSGWETSAWCQSTSYSGYLPQECHLVYAWGLPMRVKCEQNGPSLPSCSSPNPPSRCDGNSRIECPPGSEYMEDVRRCVKIGTYNSGPGSGVICPSDAVDPEEAKSLHCIRQSGRAVDESEGAGFESAEATRVAFCAFNPDDLMCTNKPILKDSIADPSMNGKTEEYNMEIDLQPKSGITSIYEPKGGSDKENSLNDLARERDLDEGTLRLTAPQLSLTEDEGLKVSMIQLSSKLIDGSATSELTQDQEMGRTFEILNEEGFRYELCKLRNDFVSGECWNLHNKYGPGNGSALPPQQIDCSGKAEDCQTPENSRNSNNPNGSQDPRCSSEGTNGGVICKHGIVTKPETIACEECNWEEAWNKCSGTGWSRWSSGRADQKQENIGSNNEDDLAGCYGETGSKP